MAFNSGKFLVFFPCAVIIYFLLPKKAKSVWLLACSYYFYMSWNPAYILLLIFSTLVTYSSGIMIDDLVKKGSSVKKKKLVLILCIVVNIGMLVYFKYAGFLAGMFDRFMTGVLHRGPILSGLLPEIVLPVGISFFTFQAVSYTIDVYKGKIDAERNIIRYALFVSFFPQLVAGPIERSGNLLVQVRDIGKKRLWSYDKIISGLILMLWGFFMKVVIADRMSVIADAVYNDQASYGASMRILAMCAFAIQLYCDFAGYSTIAIGAAKVMGLNLMENFNTPYFARNVRDFWNRWHISLSSWFKDYVYFPLGGSRCSKGRTYFNLFFTFLISGIWHGAAAKFIVWGMVNGLLQIISRVILPVRKRVLAILHIREDGPVKYLEMVISFFTYAFTLILFRANSLMLASEYLAHMFTRPDFKQFFVDRSYRLVVSDRDLIIDFCAMLVLLTVGIIRSRKGTMLDVYLMGRKAPVRIASMIFLLFFILLFGQYGEDVYTQPFVYFQF